MVATPSKGIEEELFRDFFSAFLKPETMKNLKEQLLDGSFSNQQRSWIKSAIIDNYNPKSLDLSFEGWRDCPNVKTKKELKEAGFDLAFFVTKKGVLGGAQASEVGATFLELEKGVIALRRKKTEDLLDAGAISFPSSGLCEPIQEQKDSKFEFSKSERCYRILALHELGHYFGLRHEQVHPKAKLDPLCSTNLKTGAPGDNTLLFMFDSRGWTTQITSEYDEQSVMNYCHMFAYIRGDTRSKITSAKLSTGDLEVLRQLILRPENSPSAEK